jgi:glyoxylase-like metal-dependent hydrolase (beta-lactamase superfamily II)
MTAQDRVGEIARGVYLLPLGGGLKAVNVYLVGSPGGWCLVDAGWPADAPAIRAAARSLFGSAAPAGVLLTHYHPDHGGAALELARGWGCRVWLHPRELPLASADAGAIHWYAGPLDHWVILPAMRLMGARRMQAMLDKGSLGHSAAALDPAAPPPGLPGWDVLPTPGHTPGHVAFVRRSDRVALTGDAIVTLGVNSPLDLVTRRPRLSRPPWYTTWSWTEATASAATLAGIRPSLIASGHGPPMRGDLADRWAATFGGS